MSRSMSTETFSHSPAGISVAAADSAPTSYGKSPRTSVPLATSTPKPRSCMVCRSRKVRCDKQSPCSNCRRANIACVLPSVDRAPRWARRLQHDRVANSNPSASSAQEADPAVTQVLERVRNLEGLVKELSGQLERANTAGRSSGDGSSRDSPGSSTINAHETDHQMEALPTVNNSGIQKQFGRLVLQNARYVGSGFWSRVNDEIDGLKMDADIPTGGDLSTSEDEEDSRGTPSTRELERTPMERNAFFFGQDLRPSGSDLREYHPMPSQIPFLLNVFSENVNLLVQIVHMPTVTKMLQDLRGSHVTSLTPANEALMFSIYYAAITSMEEEDIMSDFGCTKSELNLKYRLGLELALAKADFLNVPDIVLVQAFAIFLFLVRRHDSPRYVWMMTGLVIRMAQALGLHRDGSHFDHLTPYEIEIRRRVWWAVAMLDVRSSEDQGLELSLSSSSFDTKLPLNINDADIEPGAKETPTERQSMTDMSFALASFEICDITRRSHIMTAGQNLEGQDLLLNGIHETLSRPYISAGSDNIALQAWVITTRLVVAKMTLITHLPVLFSSPSESMSDSIRNKLLVSAIEVAEYNHTLNADKNLRKWRWVFQTYTHWYAIVFVLIETSRLPWSPIIERAWVALSSIWLIPSLSKTDKKQRIWIPLRKLMAKAKKHRDAEINRLRGDPLVAANLEADDSNFPVPGSSGSFPVGNSEYFFRERWRKLVTIPEETIHGAHQQTPMTGVAAPSIVLHAANTIPLDHDAVPGHGVRENLWSDSNFEPSYPSTSPSSHSEVPSGQTGFPSYDTLSSNWLNSQFENSWLSADMDPSVGAIGDLDVNMDLDSEVDWYNWVETAKNMELSSGAASNMQY